MVSMFYKLIIVIFKICLGVFSDKVSAVDAVLAASINRFYVFTVLEVCSSWLKTFILLINYR